MIPIASIGWRFIGTAFALTVFCGFLAGAHGAFRILAWIFAGFTLLFLQFFRDPERQPAEQANALESQGRTALLSPADGRVADITDKGDFQCLGIFLSVFDCHVQRAPIFAGVEKVEKKNGKFLAAFDHRASEENASSTLTLRNPSLGTFKVRQITGLLARRIITRPKPGQSLKTGERYGMILMGSRVELDIPKKVTIGVKVGDYLWGGETVVGSYER